MKAKSIALSSLLIAAAAMAGLPSRAVSQQQPAQGGAQKIATANPSKIFFSMKEKTDVQQRLAQQREKLREEERSRRQKVQDLQSALELLKPDAPQYEEANKQFMTAAIEFKNWGEVSQAQSARDDKLMTKMLFDKITTAIGEIAKERGIDLVIAEQPPINIEKISADQLTQFMAQRQVLYTSATTDLSADVIARLDERYNATKK